MTDAALPATDPDSVRIWKDDFWWRLVDGTWTAVETRSSGAQWTAPPAGGVPATLEAVGRGALALSDGHPIAVATDGAVYLFTSEWGAVGARWLVGASGADALVTLPTPPLIVVLRPHPLGRQSVQLSTDYVRFAILRDKSNRYLVPWVRRTIQAAGLPDPRGRPNPDNIVAALFAQQKREMAFVNDPLHGEMMANVSDLLCLDPSGLCIRGGDCDDQIIVLGSAVASAGISIRLLVRRYANSAQSHVTLQYQARDGSWRCIDPSTDTGACSAAPYLEQFTVDIVDNQNPSIEFLGLGAHDDAATLGALDELSPDQAEAAVAIAMQVRDVLGRSSARLRQNVSAAAALGALPDEAACRLIATADLLTDAIEDGCRGARPLSVTAAGDLLIGARAADTFALVMSSRQRGSETEYGASFGAPEDADHSLGACYLVAESCDRLATSVCADTLGALPDEPSTLGALPAVPVVHGIVLPSDVLGYRQAWDPYVMGIARALTSCSAAWRLLANGQTVNPSDPAAPNVGQFATPPDATELGLWADTLAQEAQALVDSWNLHAGADDATIVLQAGAFLQDYQSTVERAGQFYAAQVKKNCPALPIPAPPSLLEQTQIIARVEGLGILAHGVLQLWGIGASGALQTYGAIANKAADLVPTATTFGAAGAILGIGLTVGALYLLGKVGAFAGSGGQRAVAASSPRRQRARRLGRASYRRVGRLSAGRLYAERIRIDRGGYDPSGRYWGVGQHLYRVSDADGEVDVYVRAPSAVTARRLAQEGKGV